MKKHQDFSKLKTFLKFNSNYIKCLDIGANSGQFYAEFHRIYPTAEFLLLEANLNCENKLKKLKVPYKIIGVSDKKGSLNFYTTLAKPRSKGASLYPQLGYDNMNQDELIKFNIEVDLLDNIIDDKEYFNFIKIDVEGSELDVINGGINTIKKCEYIMIEVSLIEFNKGAPLANQVIKKLESIGFFIEAMIDCHKDRIKMDLLFSNKVIKHNLNSISEFLSILRLDDGII
jgi:FkbM family methyltransferase